MKVLVTGGAGFIGSNLACQLQAREAEVKVVDNFLLGPNNNLANFAGEVIDGDVLDINHLLKGWLPEVIYHQAAITDTTILDKRQQYQTNVTGFQAVLDYAVNCGAKVVYASSAAVYGAGPNPMVEAQPPAPLNPYGESKLAAEKLVGAYIQEYGLVAIGLRYFNVYGPAEHHKGKMASMIWQLALQLASGWPARIFKWGEQRRDQIYVKDVVRANLLAARSEAAGIYNVATGVAVSFNEIINVLNDTLGCSYEPEYFDNPHQFYQNETLADMTKSRQRLQFAARYDIRRGIEDYLNSVDINAYLA